MYENVINYCTEFKHKLFVQSKPPVLNLQLFTNLVYTYVYFRGNHVPLSDNVYRGIVHISDYIACWNIHTLFTKNSGGDAGALLMEDNVSATNINSTFNDNYGWAGVLFGTNEIEIINNESSFSRNRGVQGGAIHVTDRATIANTDSSYVNNTASSQGGALYARFDVNIVNTKTTFIGQIGQYGGAIYMRDRGSCTNNGSIFITNRAGDGAALHLAHQTICTNIDTMFLDNFGSATGGVITFWHGVNISNTNCNFTQNKGMKDNRLQWKNY